jgi:hypothetical protein
MSTNLVLDPKDIASILSAAPWLNGAQRAQITAAKYEAGATVALGVLDAGKAFYAEHQATRRHVASITAEITALRLRAEQAAGNRIERSATFAQATGADLPSPIERLRLVVQAQQNDNNMLLGSQKR